MGFRSGQFLLPSFLSLVTFLAISRSMQCIPIFDALRFYSAAAVGLFLDIGTTVSIALFLYSAVSLLFFSSSTVLEHHTAIRSKMLVQLILFCSTFTLFLLIYDTALYYLLPLLCGSYIN